MSPIRSVVAFVAFALATSASSAQGPPDIIWMRGSGTVSSPNAAAMSADGSLIATCSTTARIWRVADGQLPRTFASSLSTPFYTIAISADGSRLAATTVVYPSEDTHIEMFDAPAGRRLYTINAGHRFGILDLAFSSDGSLLTTVGRGRESARLWQVSDGSLLGLWPYGNLTNTACAFSPDNQFAAIAQYSGGEDGGGTLRLNRVADRTTVWWARRYYAEISSISFSADGSRLAVLWMDDSGIDSPVYFYSASDGSLLSQFSTGLYHSQTLAISLNEAWLAAADQFVTRVWNLADGNVAAEFPFGCHNLFFTPDNQYLVTFHPYAPGRYWRTSDWTLAREFGQPIDAQWVEYAQQGQALVLTGKTIQGRSASDGNLLWLADSGDELAVSNDGNTFATATLTGILLARTADGSPLRTIPVGGATLTFSPDDAQLAATVDLSPPGNYGVRVWNVADGALLATIGGQMCDTAYFASGEFLLGALRYSGTFQVWRMEDQSLVREFGDQNEGFAFALSPDDSKIAELDWNAGQQRPEIRMWRVSDGQVLWSAPLEDDWPDTMKFLSAGRVLATTGRSIRFWDSESGRALRDYHDEVGNFGCRLALSPDERLFAVMRFDDVLFVARNPCHPAHGDLDADCQTSLSDLAVLLASFGTCTGDPTYNPTADIVESGCIDAADLGALLANFGK